MRTLSIVCLLLLALAFLVPTAQAQTPTPTTTQTPIATATAIPRVILEPADILPTLSSQAAALPSLWGDWAALMIGLASMLLMGSVMGFIRERVGR